MFQFTHPGKGATYASPPKTSPSTSFQFTHPGKGATPVVWLLMLRVLCFNSRTLGRVRRVGTQQGKDINYVSIHAPWEGCDFSSLGYVRIWFCFNSRTLGRVRHQRANKASSLQLFQFTHPGKGATTSGFLYTLPIVAFQFTHPGKGATSAWLFHCTDKQVSIHAPWEGCDGNRLAQLPDFVKFQFTHPGKGATV